MDAVLITGAAGFIGSHLCDIFLSYGFSVFGVDNLISGRLENIEHLYSNNKFTFIKFDVIDDLHCAKKIDLILHFASLASPKFYLDFPVESLLVNSRGTQNLLKLAEEKKARFVLASTSEVYGDPLVHPQAETYNGNTNPVGPRSVYDEGKRFAESLTMIYFRKLSLDVRIARIFNTYGPRMRLDDGRVIPNFVTQAMRDEDITIYGDGFQTRSFCYIDDLVNGIFGIAVQENIKGEIINLGYPNEISVLGLAKMVKEISKSNSRIVFKNPLEDDPKKRCPDISKAMQLLNWEPKINLKEGLINTIEYFKGKTGLNWVSGKK